MILPAFKLSTKPRKGNLRHWSYLTWGKTLPFDHLQLSLLLQWQHCFHDILGQFSLCCNEYSWSKRYLRMKVLRKWLFFWNIFVCICIYVYIIFNYLQWSIEINAGGSYTSNKGNRPISGRNSENLCMFWRISITRILKDTEISYFDRQLTDILKWLQWTSEILPIRNPPPLQLSAINGVKEPLRK